MNHDIGQFQVTSGVLVVSDPCYGRNVWCMGELKQVRNGTWNAKIERDKFDSWGERVVCLRIEHVDFDASKVQTWDKSDIHVGVDSGQAGFWDSPLFVENKGDYDDPNSFYGKACRTTDSALSAGVMTGGVVSTSGFGDGGYECFFVRAENEEIIAAKIIFITDAECEED